MIEQKREEASGGGNGEELVLGDRTIGRGQRVQLDLPVAQLNTGAEITMPVRVVRGRRPGPVIFVSGAVHGDEINGVEVVRRLLRLALLKRLRGTLIAVPVVNVFGFNTHQRYLPDRRDLNRTFPGSATGSPAARLAHLFLSEIVERSDLGIDVHTAAIHRSNLPQVRITEGGERVRELARAFGAPVVMESPGPEGTLRHAAAQREIPVLLYEAGEALRFNEWAIRAGVRGTVAVMRALGMLPQPSSRRRQAPPPPLFAEGSRWVRAPVSGILRARRGLGDVVQEGQALGTIATPLGDEEEVVHTGVAGVIIGRTNLPLVHEGDALFHIAYGADGDEAERALRRFHRDYGFEDPNLADEPEHGAAGGDG